MAQLDAQHPEYAVSLPSYRKMRDAVAGQDAIKAKREEYLTPTSSMVFDGALNGQEPGYTAYNNYLDRAIFPDLSGTAVRTFVGLLNKEETVIELPAKLEPMRTLATKDGGTLAQLLRKIHEEQLTTGRIGLLADVAAGANVPHLVTYQAENIINWEVSQPNEFGLDYLQFSIVTETGYERADGSFDWTHFTKYRLLAVDDAGTYYTYTEDSDGNVGPTVMPSVLGRSPQGIPFVVINARDLNFAPGDIPLMGVTDSSLGIYKGEADFRQTLHMLGQDTLVITGITPGSELDEDAPTRIGAGAKIELPEGGTAQFIGVNSAGLTEQRLTLDDDYKRASAEGAKLLENNTSQAESGEALRARVAAKTTTLHDVAKTSAAGLERILRQCAVWVGANPDEVHVYPNTDFVEDTVSGQDVAQLIEARAQGLPLSMQSMHEWLQKNEFTDISWEEERGRIAEEADMLADLRVADPAPTAPAQPAEEEETEEEEE